MKLLYLACAVALFVGMFVVGGALANPVVPVWASVSIWVINVSLAVVGIVLWIVAVCAFPPD